MNHANDNAPAIGNNSGAANDNHSGLRFLSVCSGIEAASVAWKPLGWKAVAFSEIEPAPCSVLKHHYPDVPNLGDMTKFKEWPDYGKDSDQPIDLLCGGTPCQSFSVAGLRAGLADPRGNLALTFLAIAERYKPKWILWENVPGVLSSASHVGSDPRTPEDPVDMGLDGQEVDTEIDYDAEEVHAFNSFLAGLSELGYGWAYVVRDAQYVRVDGLARAVPQRRRRVFVVGYLGDWRRAAAVLFEPESMCGNPAPRREARKDVAPTLSARTKGGGGLGTDFDLDGGLITDNVSQPLLAKGNSSHDDSKETYVPVAFGGGNTSEIDVATTLTTKNQRIDFEAETFVTTRDVAATLTRGSENESGKGGYAGRRQEDDDNLVAHTLRAEGFDASEDGTGRGTPIVPVPHTLAIRGRDGEPDLEWRQDGTANAILTPNGGRAGVGVGAICFGWQNSASQGDSVSDEISPTLDKSKTPAVAWSIMPQNSGKDFKARQVDVAQPLMAGGPVGGNQGGDYIQESAWAVRRLTPKECARLQGFPDDYLSVVLHNGKPLADGPMYKAFGNSWPVNSVRWIGRRIQLVEEVAAELAASSAPATNNKDTAIAA